MKQLGKQHIIIYISGFILFLCACNLKNININYYQRYLFTEPSGGPLQIGGQCFVLDASAYGDTQWGNAIYYYSSAIMYLLRNGATGVFMTSAKDDTGRPRNPIGVPNLDGKGFGPEVSSVKKDNCIFVNPKYVGPEKSGKKEGTTLPGSMQDLMEFRNQWTNDTKSWPSSPYNPNPFLSDFGIEPTIHDITKSLGVDLSEVIVMHIRQGDVMWRANKQGEKIFGHSQPPCAFYEDVVETGYENGTSFPFLMIITNKAKEELQVNPCHMFLVNKYITGQHKTKLLDYDLLVERMDTVHSHAGAPGEHEGMRKDLHILSEAVNVAEGHSTFTMGTTLLNYNLKRHFFVANPATINSVPQAMFALNGNMIHTRHIYTQGIEQTQYILNDWLGQDASCKFFHRPHGNLPLGYFINHAGELAKTWDAEKTNFSNFALSYNRSSMMKWKTSDKPFSCASVEHLKDNPTWFIPCICDV